MISVVHVTDPPRASYTDCPPQAMVHRHNCTADYSGPDIPPLSVPWSDRGIRGAWGTLVSMTAACPADDPTRFNGCAALRWRRRTPKATRRR